ncbi:hypothetical protein DFH09DRAFT_1071114 [Mycena vulgaris]|nr:hypothetical protein DFH09DRAFT_1071114 [Mycena vulgaris]
MEEGPLNCSMHMCAPSSTPSLPHQEQYDAVCTHPRSHIGLPASAVLAPRHAPHPRAHASPARAHRSGTHAAFTAVPHSHFRIARARRIAAGAATSRLRALRFATPTPSPCTRRRYNSLEIRTPEITFILKLIQGLALQEHHYLLLGETHLLVVPQWRMRASTILFATSPWTLVPLSSITLYADRTTICGLGPAEYWWSSTRKQRLILCLSTQARPVVKSGEVPPCIIHQERVLEDYRGSSRPAVQFREF